MFENNESYMNDEYQNPALMLLETTLGTETFANLPHDTADSFIALTAMLVMQHTPENVIVDAIHTMNTIFEDGLNEGIDSVPMFED